MRRRVLAQVQRVSPASGCFYSRVQLLMIRKLKSGEFRIYSRSVDKKTGKRKNLGTFPSREKAQEHERAIQYFKHS